jgi:hypothetical protein
VHKLHLKRYGSKVFSECILCMVCVLMGYIGLLGCVCGLAQPIYTTYKSIGAGSQNSTAAVLLSPTHDHWIYIDRSGRNIRTRNFSLFQLWLRHVHSACHPLSSLSLRSAAYVPRRRHGILLWPLLRRYPPMLLLLLQ